MALAVQLAVAAGHAAAPQHHPILLRFPNGVPYQLDHNPDLAINVWARTPAPGTAADRLAHRIVQFTTGDDDIEFTGRNFGARHTRTKVGRRMAVAVFDPATGHATLTPADTILSMTQCVVGVDDVEPAARQTDGAAPTTAGAKKRTLIDQFGSKKKQRQIRSMAASQVRPEHGSSVAALTSALQDSATHAPGTTRASLSLSPLASQF